MEVAEKGFTRLGKAASLLAAMTIGVVLFGCAESIRAECIDCHPTGRATSFEELAGNDERDG